jgi:tubby-related protein 1
MPPPSAPLGANPYSAPRPNPLFNASSGGGAGSGMQQNPLAAMGASGMNQRQQQQVQQQVQPPAFDRHTMAMYAERRSFNISGDGHDNAVRVPDGQVRGFNDGSPHSIGTRGPAFEPDGVTELRRDLEAHGLADEFDPNEGRHPMEVAAERERTQRIEAAAKLGPKAKRIAERPKAARVDASDKRMFLMQPGPLDAPVQCHIVRRVTKGYLPGRNFPEYFLYLDGPGAKPGDPTNEAKFLLSARKRKKSKSSNYVISLDEEDMARQSGNFFAKLRSNFVGTEFTIYDKGSKPGEKPDGKSAGLEPRQDLGAVTYEYNVLGTRGPRKMKGYIPAVEGGRRGPTYEIRSHHPRRRARHPGQLQARAARGHVRAGEQVATVERADAGVLPQLQRPRDARVGEELSARGRSRRGRAGHVAVREGWQGYVHHGLHVAHECLAGVRDLSHVLRQQAGVRVTLRFSKPYTPLYYHPSKSHCA